MPQIDRVNVATLSRLADIAGTHDRLVATAEGGIQTSGRVSAFFTAKATHRATAEAFLGAIRNKYGDGIADALAPQLSAMRRQGKPLKARVARDILAQASNMSQALGPANTEMARRFLLGNNGAGDTRNLDHALQDFYAKNNLQPSPALRQAFERIIRYMHDQGVGYGSINHPLDRDPVCGYVGVINGQCPRCGRKEGEAVSQETLKMLRRKYPHMPNCCR